MTPEQRKQAAVAVAEWITEYHGEDAALFWVWERTPMPVGLPDDEQLEAGLRMALAPKRPPGRTT